jgi:hypothetical protein
MAKAHGKKTAKKRANKYEKKVEFEGSFIDMVNVSIKDADKKKKPEKEEKKG